MQPWRSHRPPLSQRDREKRLATIAAILEAANGKATSGPCAARSQDFLYGENWLPSYHD